MIVSCEDTESPERVERMRFALALAERKLEQLCERQSPNVFPMPPPRGGVR